MAGTRQPFTSYLNLRFTGRHRYKASADIISVFNAGPLAVEQVAQTRLGWLPEGRAALRDQRLQRENLNGLLIPAHGLAGVFAVLGIGDQWAQDPPQYARVADEIWLRQGLHPVRLVLSSDARMPAYAQSEQNANGQWQSIVYYAPEAGRLKTITTFLSGSWVNVEVAIAQQSQNLRIRSETDTFELNIQPE